MFWGINDFDKGGIVKQSIGDEIADYLLTCADCEVHDISYSKDGILAAAASKSIFLKSADLGQLIFRGHNSFTTAVDIFPTSTIMASGDESGNIILWNLSSGEQIKSFETDPSPIKDLLFSADGKYLLSSSQDGFVTLWGLPPGE
ncbi:MAG: hypothetical protein ISR58_09540 [Anaerolineales bacterium]|nr:hypothetical protein [Chloroflexota bacterium]MBL6981419.1 hypothetical protein [Anaerolineales bacterium]